MFFIVVQSCFMSTHLILQERQVAIKMHKIQKICQELMHNRGQGKVNNVYFEHIFFSSQLKFVRATKMLILKVQFAVTCV